MTWFKKYFIPHRGNRFTPHVFREAGLAALFIFVIVLFALALSGRYILIRTDLTALVLPKVLVDYANDDRSNEHYGKLKVSPTLEKAAQMKANDMAQKSYFAHTSPDGKTPWYWLDQAGYDYTYAGENLAVNFDDSVEVNKAWMNSPGHRANIMNSNFTEIGVATAEGMYQGRKTVFVVQLFGRPAAQFPRAAAIVPTPATKTAQTRRAVTEAVLGESVSAEHEGGGRQTDLYISVQKASAVAGTTTENKQSNVLERMLASPGNLLRLLYSGIVALILFGLVMMLIVEIRRQNTKLIALSLCMVFIIFGLLYVYQSVLFAPLLVV